MIRMVRKQPSFLAGSAARLLRAALLAAALVLAPAQGFAAPAIPEGSPINAAAGIMLDMKNRTLLFESNSLERIAPASLTKVMSMAVAMDEIEAGRAQMDMPVTISRHAASQGGSCMGLVEGETVPLRELLLGMAVASGNDASMAVAEGIGGDEKTFVGMMNAKARSLGMLDTFFVNPNGLPAKEQRTTARDMLILANDYLRNHPEALILHNTHYMRHGPRINWNHNPLLGNYPGADGLKTGWIRKSGYNIIATAQRGDRRLLLVILGGADPTSRAQECFRLLDAGFQEPPSAAAVAAALAHLPASAYDPDLRLTAREAFAHWNITPRKQVQKRSKKAMRAKKKASSKTASKSRSKGKNRKARSTAKKRSSETSQQG